MKQCNSYKTNQRYALRERRHGSNRLLTRPAVRFCTAARIDKNCQLSSPCQGRRYGTYHHSTYKTWIFNYSCPLLQLSWAGRWSVPALWAFRLTGHDQEKAVVCTITIEYCVFLYLYVIYKTGWLVLVFEALGMWGEGGGGGCLALQANISLGGKKPLSYCCQPPSSL